MRRKPSTDRVAGPAPDGSRNDVVRRLFDEHNKSLVRFLRPRLRSDQEARDVAQEAYVRLLQLDAPGAVSFLRAYLFRIAANLATDHVRRLKVRHVIHADPLFDGGCEQRDPERSALARDQLAVIEAALHELPEKVRTAFLLHRVDGLSMAQIGQQLGMTERSAYNQVIRAMVHCRQRLDGPVPLGQGGGDD